MRTLAEFTKTTLIGGVLIILPIYISILLIAKAISGVLNMVKSSCKAVPMSLAISFSDWVRTSRSASSRSSVASRSSIALG